METTTVADSRPGVERRSDVMTATTTPLPRAAEQPRPKRRSSRLGRLLAVVFTFAAINGLLGQIGSFRDVGAALARAQWSWVVLALVCSALAYPVSALGIRAGLGARLPLRPIVALRLSSKFADLMTPAGLGSTALNVRFMQRQGVDAASTITADVATGVVSGIAEVTLALVCLWVAGTRLNVGELPPGTGRVILLATIGVGVIVAIVSRIPAVRNRMRPHLQRSWSTIVELARTPRRTLVILASALLSNLLFVSCLWLALRAYGAELPLTTLIAVNWVAGTLGSVSPVPGGLGVAEAGLVAGLTASGIPADVAVAAALTHRLVTFWLPPIAGWFALRHLQREELL
jgi:glycosyltransferase 2 family protein